jgi:hypothetical protein
MRASEILRGLADLIDNAEGDQPSPTITPQQAAHGQAPMSKFTPVNQEPEGLGVQGVFVPPLQVKLELLKKSVGVDSVYDHGGADENLTGYGGDNEQGDIARMKQMAGIKPAVMDALGDDEPLDV